MKTLLLILGVAIVAGYFVVERQVRSGVQTAMQNHTVILGMTENEAKKSLGEPLAIRTTKEFLGDEVVMTFSDGNEVTFRRGRATKVQTVELNAAMLEVKKAVVAKQDREAGRSTPVPTRGSWMWKDYKNPLDHPRKK